MRGWWGRGCRPAFAFLVALLGSAIAPIAGSAQPLQTPDSAGTRVATTGYPALSLGRELRLLGLGADLALAGHLVPVPIRRIPSGGLDPSEIPWGWDRERVGLRSVAAGRASDRTRDGALVLPLLIAFVAGEPGERWTTTGRSGLLLMETLAISGGLTQLGKRSFGRARPHAYASPNGPANLFPDDGPGRGTFHSMPSGHSSAAWAAAMMGVTDHLLRRPDAPRAERVAVGFVAGALAGATAALRVEAGAHFPTDVVAGAGIGFATGITVPLVHRGDVEVPRAGAWAESLVGTALGAGVALLLARRY